jgi:hypothetical protein
MLARLGPAQVELDQVFAILSKIEEAVPSAASNARNLRLVGSCQPFRVDWRLSCWGESWLVRSAVGLSGRV